MSSLPARRADSRLPASSVHRQATRAIERIQARAAVETAHYLAQNQKITAVVQDAQLCAAALGGMRDTLVAASPSAAGIIDQISSAGGVALVTNVIRAGQS